MILDPVNALFKDDWLVHDEVAEDSIEQVTVGVDPSGGADEVGIVASALLNDGRFAVLADRSTSGSPAQWGEAAVKCHDDFEADDVVVEVNFGGDLVEVIKQAVERIHRHGERDSNMIRIKEVSASRGKAMRAEPISLLYVRPQWTSSSCRRSRFGCSMDCSSWAMPGGPVAWGDRAPDGRMERQSAY